MAMQNRLVGDGFGEVALAGAGLTDQQGVITLDNELERVQFEARGTRWSRLSRWRCTPEKAPRRARM